eukprot:6205252-Pleurochrysis_carterae.AAC.1
MLIAVEHLEQLSLTRAWCHDTLLLGLVGCVLNANSASSRDLIARAGGPLDPQGMRLRAFPPTAANDRGDYGRASNECMVQKRKDNRPVAPGPHRYHVRRES